MTLPIPPYTIPEAIAREEGFYIPGTRAQRNNNPGNIEQGQIAGLYGSFEGDPRFAVFKTVEEGFDCLAHLLRRYYAGLTIAQAIAKWAPPNENNTKQYIRNVCAWTELTPDTIIDNHLERVTNATPTTT